MGVNIYLNRCLNKANIDCNYIRVFNVGSFETIFYINFTFRSKKILLQSDSISQGKDYRLCIPLTATSIKLTIDAYENSQFHVVFNNFITLNNNRCFVISGTFLNPSYTEMPCNNIYN
ncbi:MULTISPECIES: hypothetical protein [Clostridium]|uniref:Uncharacterized protein n=1 Tax=Clostridium botulinum D str. 1873 TaxID=592027 RepID=A0A9N7G186_CLOBO|nr:MULTISPECIES: hypothetical protein [Clostridium]ACT33717.1 conserved hypothetical protein [Clostridium botulinum D str. 1873]KMJ93066.1 hypothetical protein CBCST_p3CbCSt0030 [Clostridium botulinum C str. Stockholm]MBO3442140.1 hypothetical protein [Clostridium haemolyticum]QPW56696.1 hypothetical protein IRP61_12285 [Clostridium botulinum]